MKNNISKRWNTAENDESKNHPSADTSHSTSRRICQAFGDSAANERTARSGDLSLCDEARTGQPQALDDEDLQVAIEEDSSQTCGELARQFNTSNETVRLHLHHLGKMYRLSKWIPHTLLEVHKHDENWVLYDTPKRSKHWLSSPDTVPHSAKPAMHPRKIMLCVWWTCREVVHYELLPTDLTVTADLYSQQLERVQQALHQKEPALVNRLSPLLFPGKSSSR
ncbi:histone-lysine N-methyltransferase SETMAR [Trichonephila clavipes]|nr:histone-lysine N-methyltransferase SETMAR [Trichonephila clavipes]